MNHRALAGILAVSIAILTLAIPSPSRAQCILSPDNPGQNGQTRRQNFYILLDDLYAIDFEPTHRELINGKYLQVPPWYELDHRCDSGNLKKDFGLTSPSRQHYLMNGDQFSELAVVTALGNNESRMVEIHNTIEELKSPLNGAGNFGLPWISLLLCSQ